MQKIWCLFTVSTSNQLFVQKTSWCLFIVSTINQLLLQQTFTFYLLNLQAPPPLYLPWVLAGHLCPFHHGDQTSQALLEAQEDPCSRSCSCCHLWQSRLLQLLVMLAERGWSLVARLPSCSSNLQEVCPSDWLKTEFFLSALFSTATLFLSNISFNIKINWTVYLFKYIYSIVSLEVVGEQDFTLSKTHLNCLAVQVIVTNTVKIGCPSFRPYFGGRLFMWPTALAWNVIHPSLRNHHSHAVIHLWQSLPLT